MSLEYLFPFALTVVYQALCDNKTVTGTWFTGVNNGEFYGHD